MQLVVMVLGGREHVKPVLRRLLSLGVSGATIVPSTGMGRTLADEVPVFGGLRRMLNGDYVGNTTLFSVVEDSMVDAVIGAVREIVGDLDKPGAGILFTLPVDQVVGVVPRPRIAE